MWDRLRKQVATGLEQLQRLMATHQELLSRVRDREPGVDEIPALAAILHSSYSGIERLLKRVAIEVDGEVPRGEFWHTELLESMARASPKRPAVLSQSLGETLQEYMDFRHVFRHAYTFELRWRKMARLALTMQATLRRVEDELGAFLKAIGS